MFRDQFWGEENKKDRFVFSLYLKCILDYLSFKTHKTKLSAKIKQQNQMRKQELGIISMTVHT